MCFVLYDLVALMLYVVSHGLCLVARQQSVSAVLILPFFMLTEIVLQELKLV